MGLEEFEFSSDQGIVGQPRELHHRGRPTGRAEVLVPLASHGNSHQPHKGAPGVAHRGGPRVRSRRRPSTTVDNAAKRTPRCCLSRTMHHQAGGVKRKGYPRGGARVPLWILGAPPGG